jgi:hypothetical protein
MVEPRHRRSWPDRRLARLGDRRSQSPGSSWPSPQSGVAGSPAAGGDQEEQVPTGREERTRQVSTVVVISTFAPGAGSDDDLHALHDLRGRDDFALPAGGSRVSWA